jgi:putative membrane protein insertion efficiency factor
MKTLAVAGLRIYKTLISPMVPAACRYVPSCSEYAAEAVARYGFFRGVVLAGWRLLRCNPLVRGGYDPVPQRSVKRDR